MCTRAGLRRHWLLAAGLLRSPGAWSLARPWTVTPSAARSGRWTARDAEDRGCLRIFAPAPPGARRPELTPCIHHDDGSSISLVQQEVGQLQAHLRQTLTAGLLKETEPRAACLSWLAAVICACELSLKPPTTDPRRMPPRASDACLINLSAVLLQLCEPFCDPSPTRTGKGHDGFTRLDARWFDRELARRLPHAQAHAKQRNHTLRRKVEDDVGGAASAPAASSVATSGSGASGSGGDAAAKVSESGGGDAEMTPAEDAEAAELAMAIKMSLSEEKPAAEPSAAALPPPPPPPLPASAPVGTSSARASAGAGAEGAATSAATESLPPEFHFVTECFFLAMGALHVRGEEPPRALLDLPACCPPQC